MAHKHWPKSHPYYEAAPTCRFRTVKDCDEFVTQFSHGHAGVPCIKQQQPSKSKRGKMNAIATCTIVTHYEVGESFEAIVKRQLEEPS